MQAPFIYMGELKTLSYGCDGTFTKQPNGSWTSSDEKVRAALADEGRRLVVIYPGGLKTVALSDAAADVFIPVDPKAAIEVIPVGGPKTLQTYLAQICQEKRPSVAPPVEPPPAGPTTYPIKNPPRLHEGVNTNVRLVITARRDGRPVQITYTGTVTALPTSPTGFTLSLILTQKGDKDFPATIDTTTYVTTLSLKELTFREVKNGGREFVAQNIPDEVKYHAQLSTILGKANATDAECKAKLAELERVRQQTGETLDQIITRKVAAAQKPAPDAALEKYRAQLKTILDNPNATDAECKAKLAELERVRIQTVETLDEIITRKVAAAQKPAPDAALERYRAQLKTILGKPDATDADCKAKLAELERVRIQTVETLDEIITRKVAAAQKPAPDKVEPVQVDPDLETYRAQLKIILHNPEATDLECQAELARLKTLAAQTERTLAAVIRAKVAKAEAAEAMAGAAPIVLHFRSITDAPASIRATSCAVQFRAADGTIAVAIGKTTSTWKDTATRLANHLKKAPGIGTYRGKFEITIADGGVPEAKRREIAVTFRKAMAGVAKGLGSTERLSISFEAIGPSDGVKIPAKKPQNFTEALASTDAKVVHPPSVLKHAKGPITLVTFSASTDDVLTSAIQQLATAATAMGIKGKRLFLISHNKQNGDGKIDGLDVEQHRAMVLRVMNTERVQQIIQGSGLTNITIDVKITTGTLPSDLAQNKAYFATSVTVAIVPTAIPIDTPKDVDSLYDAIMAHYDVKIDRGPKKFDIGFPTPELVEKAGLHPTTVGERRGVKLPEGVLSFRTDDWKPAGIDKLMDNPKILAQLGDDVAKEIDKIGTFLRSQPAVSAVVIFLHPGTWLFDAMGGLPPRDARAKAIFKTVETRLRTYLDTATVPRLEVVPTAMMFTHSMHGGADYFVSRMRLEAVAFRNNDKAVDTVIAQYAKAGRARLGRQGH